MPFDPSEYARVKAGAPDKPRANVLGVGKHIVVVSDHEIMFTSTGLKVVNVTFTAENGAQRKHRLITEGAAAPYQWWRLLEAVGWPMTESLDEDDDAAVRDAVYDHRVQIVVADERKNGVLTGYQEVKWINPAPGGTGQPARTGRTPGDRFGGASPRVPDERTPPPPGDEDVPF